jgi:hypothetical protein
MQLKFTAIILILMVFLSGLSFISISAEETLDSEENPITITTDKDTYYKGEPVKIKISGMNAWTSTYLDWGYVITDEDGNWVRDPPSFTTYDVIIVDGDINYLWNQTYDFMNEYDLEGTPRVHYDKNGEQVPTGRYFIHFLLDMDIFVEIEIIDSSAEISISLKTDKDEYYPGEIVIIIITNMGTQPIYVKNGGNFQIKDYLDYIIYSSYHSGDNSISLQPGESAIYTWNQSYLPYTASTRYFAGPGNYFLYYLGHPMGKIVGPAVFKIKERDYVTSKSVLVSTDKYFYEIGEIISITMKGSYSTLSSEMGLIDYIIEDINGNLIVEQQMYFILCGNEPWLTWKGIKYYQWNQTYLIYNKIYHNLYSWEESTLKPPSGEQVPPGKYYVYASLNGRKISEPKEFEIVGQTNTGNEKKLTDSFSSTKIFSKESNKIESSTVMIMFGLLVGLISVNLRIPSKRSPYSIF